MLSRRARRSIWVLAVLGLAVLGFVMVLPYFASTQIVRNRIAQEVSAWSGYRVAVRGAPSIEIWPTFGAVLPDVSFYEWGKPDAPPVLQTNRIHLDLSAITAMRGEISITRGVLFAPVLRVAQGEGFVPLPPAPGGGRMMHAVASARSVVDANPGAPDVSALPSDPLGAIEFIDGRVLLVGEEGESEIVTGLTGRANWPTLNRNGSLTARGNWRGETVSVEMAASHPLALFGGGSSRVTFSLNAAPLSAAFEGQASLTNRGFVDGVAKMSSPALARALEWAGSDITAGATIGPASISGRVSGDMQRFKIDNAEVVLGNSPGAGVIELALTGRVPAVSGTLAFNALDLRSFLFAFTRMPDDSSEALALDASFANELNLDLRLSAARATAGDITLTDVAATAQIRDGFAAFDISDATAFGGELQAGLRMDRGEQGDEGQIRVLAENVDIHPFATAMGLSGPIPRSRGTVSLMLKAPANSWQALYARASGPISIRAGSGYIAGLDMNAFLKRAREGDFFPLSDVAGADLPIEAAELKANLSNGVARLDIARVISGENAISFTGIIPYVGRGLALSGTIMPKKQAQEAPFSEPISTFFVGGSWTTPFISPVLRGTPYE